MTTPGYRIEWRTSKRGVIAHAVITDVHEWVTNALFEDSNGGWFSDEDMQRSLSHCLERNRYVNRAGRSDKRCEFCLHNVAELDAGIDLARTNWAIGKLDSAIQVLASVAPIDGPDQVTRE